MPPARVPDELRHAPFTRAQARAAGITDAALQTGPWRRVFRGVWVHDDVTETRQMRLAAARLVLPDRAVLCGLTAAWVWGADVRRADDLDIHVSFPAGGRIRKRPGLAVSEEALASEDVAVVDGVRVTTPLRTAFDCLRLLRGGERLVVADALAHLGLVTIEELRRYFASKHRLRNLRVAELLVDQIEPASESPMETRLRWCLLDGGLPRPIAQYELRTPAGTFVARLDLAYPELRLAIEYDGAWHFGQRRHDDRRRDAARALGWTVLVFSADDYYSDRDGIVREVRAARRGRLTTG